MLADDLGWYRCLLFRESTLFTGPFGTDDEVGNMAEASQDGSALARLDDAHAGGVVCHFALGLGL